MLLSTWRATATSSALRFGWVSLNYWRRPGRAGGAKVKTHTNSMFSKLQFTSRTQAIVLARGLQLL